MTQEEYVTVDLRDIAVLLRRRIATIGLFAVLGTVAGFAGASLLTASYQASGEIVVKAEASTASDPDRAFGAIAINEAVVTTERDVLLAHGLVERVTNAVSIPPALLHPSRFRAMLAGLADRLRPLLGDRSGAVGEIGQRLGLAQFLTPSSATEQVNSLADRRFALVRSSLSTNASKESSVISVTAVTPDAALSTSIVNTLLNGYMQDRVALQNGVAANTESVLRKRLEEVRASIRTLEAGIAEASAKPGLLESTEVPVQLRQLPIIGSRLAEAQATLATRQAAYDSLAVLRQDGQNDPSRTIGLVDQGGTSTSDLRRSYMQAVQQLTLLKARHGANYPGVVEAQNQVASLGTALSQETGRLVEQRRAERDAAAATVTALTQQYDQLRSGANARVSSGLSLDREREALASLRHNAQLIDDRLIDLAARPMDPSARILSFATVPSAPSFPKKSWIAVAGGFLAVCLSVAWLIVGDHLRRLRPSPGKQADWFGANLVGCIPLFGGPSSRERIFKVLRGGVDRTMPGSLAFQGIALQCEDIIQSDKIRVLAVTSGSHSEGKSTVVTGLALALASLGSRVLVIDCDMRKPSVVRLFGRDCRTLHGIPQACQDLNLQEDITSGVHIAALPAAPSLKYLRSPEFRDLLAFGRKFYDVVLCDTTPLLMVPDALIVAKQADAILLVAESGRHDTDKVREIARQTAKSRSPICGVVLTKLAASGDAGDVYIGYGEPRARSRRAPYAISAG